jgi:HSP20 family molecular chaperone IbpA
MALPAGVNASKIAATVRDGVVEVAIPLPTGANRERITITPETA